MEELKMKFAANSLVTLISSNYKNLISLRAREQQ